MDGAGLAFQMNLKNGASPTLLDGLGAKPLNSPSAVAVPAGSLRQGTIYQDRLFQFERRMARERPLPTVMRLPCPAGVEEVGAHADAEFWTAGNDEPANLFAEERARYWRRPPRGRPFRGRREACDRIDVEPRRCREGPP
jgi:hypothetical protein